MANTQEAGPLMIYLMICELDLAKQKEALNISSYVLYDMHYGDVHKARVWFREHSSADYELVRLMGTLE